MKDTSLLSFQDDFLAWLSQEKDYDDSTITGRLSNLKKIEETYGKLPTHWKQDYFESLHNELTYTKKDEAKKKKYGGKIPINGNVYNGLSTYRSALRLYGEFLMNLDPDVAGYPFGKIGKQVYESLKILSETVKRKKKYTQREVDTLIISPLIEILENKLGSLCYVFKREITSENDDTKDRYDIIGIAKDKPLIIIEADTHRSDQISKKVLSRVALNSDKEMLYVALIYPNDHKIKEYEKLECMKYLRFIRSLFSLFSDPQKIFMPHWLFKK